MVAHKTPSRPPSSGLYIDCAFNINAISKAMASAARSVHAAHKVFLIYVFRSRSESLFIIVIIVTVILKILLNERVHSFARRYRADEYTDNETIGRGMKIPVT